MSHRLTRSGRQVMLALVAAAALVTLVAFPALAADKEWICHAAGQEGSPKYIAIEPSGEAGSENSKGGHFNEDGSPKAGHEEDFLLTGDFEDKDEATEACNAPQPTPTPTPTATPTPEVTPTPTPTPTGGVNEGTPTPTPTPAGNVAGGNPTPTPAGVPNTAMSAPSSIAGIALALVLIGSLMAMAYVRLARQPR